jgi:hypothetical protein
MKESVVTVGVGETRNASTFVFWVVEEKGPLERRLALGGNVILQRS